jgi:nuclease-like protein
MKSPIKDNPLRNPAESLDKEIDDLLNEDVATYIIIAVVMLVMTLMEFWRWYMESPVSPITYVVLSFIIIPLCIFKLYKLRKRLKNLKQGRDGEKVVGQYFELLRERSAKVFHDIPGEKFNLDHVVICSSGVYVIETKTYSKPDSGPARMIFDGTSLSFNNIKNNEKPIIQVLAASNWLKNLLKESTGRTYSMKPVVVFPGWFIEPTSEARNSEVWVLNPKALPTFISNSKEQLSEEDVSLIAFHLSRYVRSCSN